MLFRSNSVCANLSMLSPIRVSMGIGVMKLATSGATPTEGEIYRRSLPLALAPVLVGLGTIILISLLR